MFIPENKEVPKTDLEKISILIFGESMKGKTWMANTFPEPLFLNTDGNTQDVSRDVIDLRGEQDFTMNDGSTRKISKWNLFKAYVMEFEKQEFITDLKSKGYKTIVIDLADHLFEWTRGHHLTLRGLNTEQEDTRHGLIYDEIKKDFRDTMIRLIESVKSDFNLVILTLQGTEEYYLDGVEKKTRFVSSIKTKTENANGVDKSKTFEAILSRLGTFGGIFQSKINQGEEMKEVRYFHGISSNEVYAGNRLGINTIVAPSFDALTNARKEIKEEKND